MGKGASRLIGRARFREIVREGSAKNLGRARW